MSSSTPRAMMFGYLLVPPTVHERLPRCFSAVQPFQKHPKKPRWLRVSMCVPQWV